MPYLPPTQPWQRSCWPRSRVKRARGHVGVGLWRARWWRRAWQWATIPPPPRSRRPQGIAPTGDAPTGGAPLGSRFHRNHHGLARPHKVMKMGCTWQGSPLRGAFLRILLDCAAAVRGIARAKTPISIFPRRRDLCTNGEDLRFAWFWAGIDLFDAPGGPVDGQNGPETAFTGVFWPRLGGLAPFWAR